MQQRQSLFNQCICQCTRPN